MSSINIFYKAYQAWSLLYIASMFDIYHLALNRVWDPSFENYTVFQTIPNIRNAFVDFYLCAWDQTKRMYSFSDVINDFKVCSV